MASPITRAEALRWWIISSIASLCLGCPDSPIGGIGSNDAGLPRGFEGGPLLERIFTPDLRDTLGRACAADADCPMLKCIKPTDTSMGGGGPAHGYCSVACTAADDTICKVADGVCVNFAVAGSPEQDWCVQTCHRGGDAPDMNKCRGRNDVSCTPSSVANGQPSGDAYCLPTCNGDADCGARRCDPSSGVCVDAISGDPTGDACSSGAGVEGGTDASGDMGGDSDAEATGDPDAATSDSDAATSDSDAATDEPERAVPSVVHPSDCAGVCLAVGASTHVCAQRCTYGSPTACQLPDGAIDGGVGAYSACVFVAQNGSTGVGDEAHCGQLCDTSADCLDQLDPGVICNNSDVSLKAFGHGFCDWPIPAVDAVAGDP